MPHPAGCQDAPPETGSGEFAVELQAMARCQSVSDTWRNQG